MRCEADAMCPRNLTDPLLLPVCFAQDVDVAHILISASGVLAARAFIQASHNSRVPSEGGFAVADSLLRVGAVCLLLRISPVFLPLSVPNVFEFLFKFRR